MLFHLETRILLVFFVLHVPQIYWVVRFWQRASPSRKWLRLSGVAAILLLQIPWFTLFFGRSTVALPIPESWLGPYRVVSATWGLGTFAALLGLLGYRFYTYLFRYLSPTTFQPARRRVLETGLGIAPWVMVAYGVVSARVRHRTERVTVPIAELPRDLEGLRIVQLTDVHVSEDMPPELIERIVEEASELEADLGMLTGDYLAFDQWGLEECVAALSKLRTHSGILGCLGNHEIHTEATERITREFDRRGVDILRGEGRDFGLGSGRLRIVGVDYQRSTRAPLWTVDKLMASGVPNFLLSHNPNVFPHAAELGFDLTLAGHTHGGQVSVEILEKEISPSRFMSPYVQGLYQQGKSRLYVSRGIGTSGLPIRLGAPPEVTLITLTRA